MKRIVLVQGHPDPAPERFGRLLAAAYADSARRAGYEVSVIDVASLDFPLLRTRREWEQGEPPAAIAKLRPQIEQADHFVFFYPLWLGDMPALLKAFLEQLFRPGFGIGKADGGSGWKRLFKGKSARIIVTMGMPGFVYRWFFGAHSLKSFKRNILSFCGIAPVGTTIIGMIEGRPAARDRHLAEMGKLGADAR